MLFRSQQPAPQPVAQPAPQAQPVQAVAPTQLPPMPQPGPGVQVAGAPGAPMPQTQPAPAPQGPAGLGQGRPTTQQVAEATTPAPAPVVRTPDYSSELRDIATNPRALAAYIGSKDPSDPSVKIANDLYMLNMQGTVKAADAEKILGAAAQGDRQAQNQLMKDLRSDEGSYIKEIGRAHV